MHKRLRFYCSRSFNELSFSSPYFPGGQNTLSVVVADDPGLYGCYGGYSMTLTYTPGTPVPSPPPVPNPTPFSTPTPPPSPSFTPVPSPSGFGDFFCCLYEDSTDTIYKSFCSPMSSCPVITGFTCKSTPFSQSNIFSPPPPLSLSHQIFTSPSDQSKCLSRLFPMQF